MDAKNCRVAYGKNIRAIVTYLACSQYMPYGRITEFLSHVFNLKISEGTVRNILKDIGRGPTLLTMRYAKGLRSLLLSELTKPAFM